ncbi:DUF6927 domain-containing protein [Roseomonas mucosa]|uniref:DUF6927 domain-containing protein n=1 Tax=Roseomonas mucosa TaxID=207340 RepID=UPI00324AF38C
MGWLVSDRPLVRETPAEHLARDYTTDDERGRTEVLAASQVGRAVYMAVRRTERTGPRAGRPYTFAAVVLVFNNARDGFGRKDMDESAGTCEVACPPRIMALLTPVEELPSSGHAADWRARVESARLERHRVAASRKHLLPGQRVRITERLSFCKGAVVATEFEVVPTPAGRRGPIFRPVGHGFLCRLPTRLLAVAMTVLPSAAS